MNDWIMKFLLALIALALWINILAPSVGPKVAVAQYQGDYLLRSIDTHLQNIDLGIDRLQSGSCANGKLCH
jgi:hypothetical protein